MLWDKNKDYSSPEIEDRRGEAPSYASGGGGGGAGFFSLFSLLSRFGWPGILIALVIGGVLVLKGGFFGGDDSGSTSAPTHQVATSKSDDELAKFVEFVFQDVQKEWSKDIPGYHDAHLVMFHQSTHSGCGTAREEVGPFYCPRDQKVYIDLGFYAEMRNKLGAPGDFAQAYVIAHELGHHIQQLQGLLRDGNSVETELQADCLAGAWGREAERRNELEPGDIDEAMNAARQIGDDTLQKRAGQQVRPETFTHGSAAQRSSAFHKGFNGGRVACGAR